MTSEAAGAMAGTSVGGMEVESEACKGCEPCEAGPGARGDGCGRLAGVAEPASADLRSVAMPGSCRDEMGPSISGGGASALDGPEGGGPGGRTDAGALVTPLVGASVAILVLIILTVFCIDLATERVRHRLIGAKQAR